LRGNGKTIFFFLTLALNPGYGNNPDNSII